MSICVAHRRPMRHLRDAAASDKLSTLGKQVMEIREAIEEAEDIRDLQKLHQEVSASETRIFTFFLPFALASR